MNIFLTFDYELFFGKRSGSLEKSILEPTRKLTSILDNYNAKATFFVDSGYLIKLQEYSQYNQKLKKELFAIVDQIKELSSSGHSIQLHIHPHWEDAIYTNNEWFFDTKRFTLNDFSATEIDSIVARYKRVLEEITSEPVFSYRAGGWCIQPFSKIAAVMKKHNIWLDSTVYSGGYYNSSRHSFDFRNAPDKDVWLFDDDVLKEDEHGFFIELPITSHPINPIFYWKFALIKLLKLKKHKYFGDGSPIGAGNKDVAKMLLKSSCGVVSLDGYKINYLNNAFVASQRRGFTNFVAIGHPKAFSCYSLSRLNLFLAKNSSCHNVISISNPNFLNSLKKLRVNA